MPFPTATIRASAVALLVAAPGLAAAGAASGSPGGGEAARPGVVVLAQGLGRDDDRLFEPDRRLTRDERGFLHDERGDPLMGERGRPVTEKSFDFYERDDLGVRRNDRGEALLSDDAPDFGVDDDGGVTIGGD
jgi:hypothetical protein